MKFKEYKNLHDGLREEKKKKPVNRFVIVFTTYFFLILLFISKIIIVSIMNSISKTSYRYSSKYKKVIKEGFFFDTIEYHEK